MGTQVTIMAGSHGWNPLLHQLQGQQGDLSRVQFIARASHQHSMALTKHSSSPPKVLPPNSPPSLHPHPIYNPTSPGSSLVCCFNRARYLKGSSPEGGGLLLEP